MNYICKLQLLGYLFEITLKTSCRRKVICQVVRAIFKKWCVLFVFKYMFEFPIKKYFCLVTFVNYMYQLLLFFKVILINCPFKSYLVKYREPNYNC